MTYKSSENQNKWVSVETELPKKDGWYLVTVKNLTGYAPLEREVFECKYFGDWIFDGWEDNHVISWMPLPKPYQSEQ